MTNTDIVRAFCAAWEARSLDDVMNLMAPDARWLNVGLPEAAGHDAIRKMVAPFIGRASMVRFDLHHIAETSAGVVLTERTDVFETNGKTQSFAVMGAFELKDGKITYWRDYFDTRALAPAAT
jgi:limonene-1,2-epoxide hydrolase